ncbi:hypothetical protein ELBI_106 [Anabaena phage Elbi]|nr:hypothetical protein ELBI_106 [Anabaena phage Elbi]
MQDLKHFSEIIGNGGITLQILQVFEIYHNFYIESVFAVKDGQKKLEDVLKELDDMVLESGQVHPDLYVTLNSVNSKLVRTLELIAPVETKSKKTAVIKTAE